MALPLMPKATAVWLVDNTTLSFGQIAEFCGLHDLEVQAIADGEVAPGMQGLDPLANRQLTKEEIERCENDKSANLEMAKPTVPLPKVRQKGARYTPISKRQDRPDAISWLLRTYPELSDAQISRLIGTTKPTINAVRDKTHQNTTNIKPQSPIYLGLCTPDDLEKIVLQARARAAKAGGKNPKTDAAPQDGTEPAVEAASELTPEAAVEPAPEPAPEPVSDSPFAAAAAIFATKADQADTDQAVTAPAKSEGKDPVPDDEKPADN
ncbi:MAG: DUF1013 domain-containing protein [Rhodospirillales bacterium]|nr:DUF1013 domain-containing protein [Rhodospirillales bacterium]